MFCPNCGAQTTESTKYCRQCGLPLSRLVEYVASRGTAPLVSPPTEPASGSIAKDTFGLTPKQQLILTIMLFVFVPGIFGVLGELIGMHQLAGIPGVLMPLGIIWAVFRYKNQMRLWRSQELQQLYGQQPQFQPQSFQPPISRPQAYQSPAAPPTNRIVEAPGGSITEDETKQLPDQKD